MDANSRVEWSIPVRQPNASFQIGRPLAGANGNHVVDSRLKSARDHFLTIGVELRTVEMAVGVDQAHFSLAPTGISSRKPASTGLPPSMDAATIMPLDSSPRSLRGCRLATITTLRPINCS